MGRWKKTPSLYSHHALLQYVVKDVCVFFKIQCIAIHCMMTGAATCMQCCASAYSPRQIDCFLCLPNLVCV